MNLLFWNMKNKGLDDCLVELTKEKDCDFVALAEYPKEIGRLCNRINLLSENNYIPVTNLGGCEKIKAFMKRGYPISILREQSRYQILMIKTSLYKLIIAMIHNISKLYAAEEEQEENLRHLHCHTKSFRFMNDKGKPDQKLYSDHLPIFVKLKEELIL